MRLQIVLTRVQHIEHLSMELDLTEHKLTCIVGKNGVGKTTLIRALLNLSSADTFIRTAARGIFEPGSSIIYTVDGQSFRFEYDPIIQTLNCRTPIPERFRSLCAVELPMPHGQRFNFFQTISDADSDIRRQITLEEFTRPDELIDFLSDIYSSQDFRALVEAKIHGRSYYSLLGPDNKYVREDYLSSGEYFLINLYRTIRGGARLIVVDEIDLSLDAAAQVHLLRKLRTFCRQYACNVLFTTHSLAMMRTLDERELLYMNRSGTTTELLPASYAYIKSLLFGFTGWDRYILTEDTVLHEFLDSMIRRFCKSVFYQYKIIYVGAATHVSGLLRRNEHEQFLAHPDHVIAILDGDQRNQAHAGHARIHFLPFDSVEKALSECYEEEACPFRLANGKKFNGPKDLFHSLQRDRVVSRPEIYQYLCMRNEGALAALVGTLEEFLCQLPQGRAN
jgi:ABC-type nitrate/sulfonate/bicarbonate transport system ATPase subunit